MLTIMKQYKRVWGVGCLSILLAASACSESNTPMEDAAGQMTFSVLHPNQQKATRATDTAFETNDQVGLFITVKDTPLEVSGNYVNNATLTFNGSQWNPAKTIYWNEGTYDVFAYYPYTTSISSVDDMPFSVALDQSTEGDETTLSGYEASDFLWATSQGVSAGNESVSLQFKHRMSRLMIQLVKGADYEGNDLPENAEVYIHNTVPSATIDLSAGVVTRNMYGSKQTIRAKSLGNQRYTAILVPQRLDNRQPLVEVIMNGVSYLYESKFNFKTGIQHNVQLAISKDPEQIKIEVGGEIENWNEE